MNSIRPLRLAGAAILILALGATAGAQSPLYTFSLPDLIANTGTVTTATMVMDSSLGLNVQGLSLGICSDSLVAIPVAVFQGATTAALNGGAGPDFWQTEIVPGGLTLGTVTDFFGVTAIPPGPNHEILDVDYDVVGSLGMMTDLLLCDTLSTPSVLTVVVVGGAAIAPTKIDGSIEVGLPAPASFKIDSPNLAFPGSTVAASILLDNLDPVSGFSFGLTSDALQITLASADPSGVLAAVNGGSGPDFFSADLSPSGGIGATVECTISTSPPINSIAVGTDQLIIDLVYDVNIGAGPPCSSAAIAFTDTLGVPVEADLPSGTEPAGTTNGGVTIGINAPNPPTGGITLEAENAYAASGSDVAARVYIDNDTAIEAFSFGISYSPDDVTLFAATMGSRLAELRCGAGPEFFSTQIHSGPDFGVTVGAVFGLQPPLTDTVLIPGSDQELLVLDFSTNPVPVTTGTALSFTDTLGSPPISVEVTIDGQASTPSTIAGSISFGSEFIRGDCNSDSGVDVADAVFLLSSLFPGPGGAPFVYCDDSCDGNDDGRLNIADPIMILTALFGGVGAQPIPPPNSCGSDPTAADAIVCIDYATCP